MRLSNALLIVVGVALGCGPQVNTGESKGDTEACELGTLNCGCHNGSSCDAGLSCVGDICVGADTDGMSTSEGQTGSEGDPTTGGQPKVVCCHDEAYEEGTSPYGHVYCEAEGLEVGETCMCRGTYIMVGIGCEYGGEERVPFCCYGEIAECCPYGPAPLPNTEPNPWTLECATCSCGTPDKEGVGSPTRDPADAQCD